MRIITCDLNSVEIGEFINGKIRNMGIPIFSIDIFYDKLDGAEHPLEQSKSIQLNSVNSIDNTMIFSHVRMKICCPANSTRDIHQILISYGATSIHTR